MRNHRYHPFAWLSGVVLGLVTVCPASADVFRMGPGLTSLDFVTVGNPGNAADQRNGDLFGPEVVHAGAVSYSYRIGTYEVTNAQYAEFLNAVRGSGGDPRPGVLGASIRFPSVHGVDSFTVVAGRENRPATFINWFDAARFVNWLNNGQGNGDTETGAYDLTGDTGFPISREPDAQYFLPSEDEWYKAAYYQPEEQGGPVGDYWSQATASHFLAPNESLSGANYFDGDYLSTGTDEIPDPFLIDPTVDVGHFVDAAGFYGTFDQGGNLWEWTDTLVGVDGTIRGGAWNATERGLAYFSRGVGSRSREADVIGFRIAAVVPEPVSLLLVAIGASFVCRKRRLS